MEIYLDHAATTPLDPEVLGEMLPYFDGAYGNPSSIHLSGRRALFAMANARQSIATTLNALPEEIIFTGSGTESDNLALLGTARAYRSYGEHIILSAIEHKAVLEAGKVLEKEGFRVTYAPVDSKGRVSVETVMSLLTDETILISVMLANNEIGTIEPVSELSRALMERRMRTGFPRIHTDACQAAGSLLLDVESLGVDLLTLNGSKVYGPKGIGVLYKKMNTRLTPIIVGGSQEQGIRAGTESVPHMVGMAAALKKAEGLRESESKRLSSLREYFIQGLLSRIPGIIINGDGEHTLPHIVHVTVPGIEGESMVLMLDHEGICAATGSACGASDLKPSHVLTALGHKDELIHGSLRFSFGRGTTKESLDTVLLIFPRIVERLRAASALTTKQYERSKK